MRVEVQYRVRKAMTKLPRRDQDRLSAAIIELEDFPVIRMDIKMLGRNSYRLRIGGYRIAFITESDLVIVYELNTRGKISYAKSQRYTASERRE